MLKALDGIAKWRWLDGSYRRFISPAVSINTARFAPGRVEAHKRGANAMQIGGKYYKQLPIEPWDYIAANGLGFFEGNIIKFVTRAARDGRREDLIKAQHYLAKLIELTPVGDNDQSREGTSPRAEPQLT